MKRRSMKTVFFVHLLLLLPAILLVAQDEIPKDYKAPYSEPPKLELKFKDDFQKDSRSDYQISGKKDTVTWEKGKLTLRDGAILQRKLNAGSWVEMELELQFPELTEDGQASELKVWLDLEDATDSFVWFRQKREKGKTRSAIFIVDTEGDWRDEPRQQPVSKPLVFAGPLGEGKWGIRYRNGLWTIENIGKDTQLFAYIENEAATVNQLLCVASKSSIECRSARLKQTAQVEINYPATVANRLASAEELVARYMKLYDDGKIAQAIPLARSYKDLMLRLKGTYDPDYATSLNNLAYLYESLGEYAKAEPLYLEAKTIEEKVLGKEHPSYATSLNNLAGLYESLGDYEKAEPLFVEAKKIDEKVLGKDHPDYANSLINLAGLYDFLGDYEKAESLYVEAKEILEKVLGKDHPDYATSLHNLAFLYFKQGDYEKAEPLYVEAKKIDEKVLGKDHPNYATSLNNLAVLYESQGDYEKAEPLYVEAKNIWEKVLGKEHPNYATSLHNLAGFYASMGEYAKVEPLLSKSLQITRNNFDRYSTIQSEKQRQTFAKSFEGDLSSFINIAIRLDERGNSVWEQAVQWKGMSLLRQKRNLAYVERPESSDTFAKLKSIRAQISKHFQSNPTATGWKDQTEKLENEEERLEKKLAQISKDLGLEQSVDVEADMQLPENSCLIDFRRFDYSEPDQKKPGKFNTEPHYLALIRQADNSVKMLGLGSAERIELAIASWRAPIERANLNRRAIDVVEQRAMDLAGKELRKLLWEPLEKHIGDSKLVIVSPDGALGRLPLIALPGKQPGTYLLEEKTIVYLPVPALLPGMLEKPAKPIDRLTRALLVGGIDYGTASKEAVPDRLSQRNQRILQKLQFSPLKNSGQEIAGIQTLFEQATQLINAEATEQTFQQNLNDHSVLHIATHGFFQSPDRFMKRLPRDDQQSFVALKEQAKVLTENPNLLSGLALANANAAGSKEIDEGDNDGILYSAEIAMLRMEHVELAVLSACETSLGTDDNPGEGLIGIQRAFQVAGAKSTIASYWKVNDKATQMLMNRFYKNLIEYSKRAKAKNQDPNSTTVRIDALRDAQLWMLRGLNKDQVAQLTRGPDDMTKVKDIKLKKSSDSKSSKTEYISHPRYWAAFVLSGDWR